MSSMQSVSLNSVIATFKLSFAASVNLGQSQIGVLGNGLIDTLKALPDDKFRLFQIEKLYRQVFRYD